MRTTLDKNLWPELRELVNKSLTKPDVIASQDTISTGELPVDNLGFEIDSSQPGQASMIFCGPGQVRA